MVIGAVLLVSAVLPAEYGIDPLGIGKATGFSKLYVGDAGTEALASGPHKILKLENVGSPADVANQRRQITRHQPLNWQNVQTR